MNKFLYSNSNKRYHTLDYFYKSKFNSKVFKVSLDGNFTCPNIDGTKGYGGCIYCLDGSGNKLQEKDLRTQFNEVKEIMLNKWPNSKYIAYFQANSNTYDSVSNLKKRFEPMLKEDNVIGLSLATRCDCISDECLEYLIDLSNRIYLTIELGLQTIHDETSKLINRCHSLESFDMMVKKLRTNNINVVVHIINGLPFETKEMMIDTVKYLSKLDIQGIKMHMLHILKNTKLDNFYLFNKFHILTLNEYVDIVINQLELLNPLVVINRITGDPLVDDLVEPSWLVKKFGVLNEIDKEMVKRDSYQGKRYEL